MFLKSVFRCYRAKRTFTRTQVVFNPVNTGSCKFLRLVLICFLMNFNQFSYEKEYEILSYGAWNI